MENLSERDDHDSISTFTQMSTTPFTFINDKTNDYERIHDQCNVVNARFNFFASKKLSSRISDGPKNDYKTAGAEEQDSYMNSLLDRHIQQKLLNCAMKSESGKKSAGSEDLDSNVAKLLQLKLFNYETNAREEQIFCESLKDGDKWREFKESIRERSNSSMINFGDTSENDEKSRETIKKNNLKIKKIEELNKTLLSVGDFNYFDDEECQKIMFKEIN